MIYDCFLYNSERNCLKLRCEELKSLDVTHILVEGDRTFTGSKKTLSIKDHDFIRDYIFKYKIKHLVCGLPECKSAWALETYQRNYIGLGLQYIDFKDDDIIIISDVDEIPRAEAIKKYKPEMGLTALKMDNFWYKFNCLTERQTWVAPRIMTYGYLKNTTPNEVRNSGYESVIDNAGWHFSYLGNEDFIANKLASFSHTEYNIAPYNDKDYIKKQIESGVSLWGCSQFEFVPIDDTFPKYLVDNQDKFSNLIHKI